VAIAPHAYKVTRTANDRTRHHESKEHLAVAGRSSAQRGR
jgi:hypothetical protein